MIKGTNKFYPFSPEAKLLGILLSVFVAIIIMAIFQDFLHSRRNGYAFYFFESLLFKSFWLFFPPILLLLKQTFQTRQLKTFTQISLALIIPTLTHLLLVPLTIWFLSVIFREQAYGFIKSLTYTLANDLVMILLIYGTFVLWLRQLKSKNKSEEKETPLASSDYLVVRSGKDNRRIKLNEILYIKAATPYIAIQLAGKELLHSESLKSIAEKLDSRFIRVHKSSIVNIDKVLSLKSRLNGDYDLALQDGSKIRLSRNYVNHFKNIYEIGPQLNS